MKIWPNWFDGLINHTLNTILVQSLAWTI